MNQYERRKAVPTTEREWIRRAGTAAMVGSGLLAADLIWQGVLDLRVGGDAMLHDSATAAYWVNNVGLFVSAVLLAVGLMGLRAYAHERVDGRLWTAGVWLTALAVGAMVVGAGAQLSLAAIGQFELSEAVGIVYGIGSMIAWVSALPFGVALWRADVMRPAAILFTAALPLLVVGLALSGVNAAVTGVLMATVGFAWIAAGYALQSASDRDHVAVGRPSVGTE